MVKVAYGIDLGGTTVKLGVFSETDELLKKWEIPTDTSDNGSHILSDISEAIKADMAERSIEPKDVFGAGIGLPGPVIDERYTTTCVNLGWGRVDVADILEDQLGFPVKCLNDATAATLGEFYAGEGRGFRSVVLLTLGTGLGCGIISDGRNLAGAHGGAGEAGHLPINPDETVRCNCGGYGCLEQYTSATGLVRMTNEYLAASDEPSSLRDIDSITAKDVWDAAKAGDAAALAVTDRYCDYLGRGAAFVANIVDPEIFLIGGGVSKAGAPLLEAVQKYYKKYAFPSCKETPFRLAALGNDAGIYGCASTMM